VRIGRVREVRKLADAGSVGGVPPVTDEPLRTIIEPFRTHSVEPMRLTTQAERAAALVAAGYNLFGLRAEDDPGHDPQRGRYL
jgi:hypothetical protein